jgi:hypothetical protein
MTKKAGLCCVAVALFALVGCKDRKLADDFEWMDNTYNPHEDSFGHGRSGWYTHKDGREVLAHGTTDSFKNDGCSFEIDIKDNPWAANNDIVSEYRYSVNLRDLDPDSVKAKTFTHFGGLGCEGLTPEDIASMNSTCDYAEMEATTRNSRPVVTSQTHSVFTKLTGKDHDNSYTSKGASVYLGFDDPDYAKKFAGVFQDAVKRCGGTKGAAS